MAETLTTPGVWAPLLVVAVDAPVVVAAALCSEPVRGVVSSIDRRIDRRIDHHRWVDVSTPCLSAARVACCRPVGLGSTAEVARARLRLTGSVMTRHMWRAR